MDKLEERLRAAIALQQRAQAEVSRNVALHNHSGCSEESAQASLRARHEIERLAPEAADEITRLKGEVERQAWEIKAHKATLAGTEVRAEQAESALAAKQALIDELAGLLEQAVEDHDSRNGEALAGNHWTNRARSLISKARSSGKAGSDA